VPESIKKEERREYLPLSELTLHLNNIAEVSKAISRYGDFIKTAVSENILTKAYFGNSAFQHAIQNIYNRFCPTDHELNFNFPKCSQEPFSSQIRRVWNSNIKTLNIHLRKGNSFNYTRINHQILLSYGSHNNNNNNNNNNGDDANNNNLFFSVYETWITELICLASQFGLKNEEDLFAAEVPEIVSALENVNAECACIYITSLSSAPKLPHSFFNLVFQSLFHSLFVEFVLNHDDNIEYTLHNK
jgi:hypothetical protein